MIAAMERLRPFRRLVLATLLVAWLAACAA
ncbi:hypothetical protein XPU_0675, partial [Xanthomonas arboricola pv. pruni str. MAFF 311562]